MPSCHMKRTMTTPEVQVFVLFWHATDTGTGCGGNGKRVHMPRCTGPVPRPAFASMHREDNQRLTAKCKHNSCSISRIPAEQLYLSTVLACT